MILSLFESIRARLQDPATRFSVTLIGYLALIGVLFNGLMMRYQQDLLFRGAEATAGLVYLLMRMFTDDVERHGAAILFGDFSANVIVECVGTLEILIYLAAVLAYPATWRQRWPGLLLGPVFILAFNVVRLATLMFIGHYSAEAFEFLHVYLWQTTLIVLIAALWLLWLRVFVRPS